MARRVRARLQKYNLQPEARRGLHFCERHARDPLRIRGVFMEALRRSDGVADNHSPELDGYGGVPVDPRGIHPRKRLQSPRKGLRPQPRRHADHKQNALGRLPNPPPPVARRRGFGLFSNYGIDMMGIRDYILGVSPLNI